jgi:Prokaryotic homologs of the JAB domain
MPIAIVDFETTYDGRSIRLTAGESWVVDGHELHKRFPGRFRPDPSPPMGARKVTSRRSGRRGSATAPPPVGPAPSVRDEREVPELRANAKPTVTVKVGSLARATIGEELAWSRSLLETYRAETGGWIFGVYDRGSWHLMATRLGSAGERKPEKVLMDYAEAERAAILIRDGEARMRFLGTWHSHPFPNSSQPSSADRTNALTFMGWRDLNPAPFAVSVILTPDRDRGWSAPQFHAWTTRRNQFGTAVTEPATIEVSPAR